MSATARRRWAGHLAVPVVVGVTTQLVAGRLGAVGFGDRTVPAEVLAVGAVIGSLYGLVGVGMVLVWRSHRLLNLAQAQLGAVPAVAALLLVAERGWPYLPAALLAVVVAAMLGAASERVVIRRFDDAPRLAATIATLGVAQVLVAVEVLMPRWLAGVQGTPSPPATPLSSLRHAVGVVTFSGDHLAAVVVGVGVSLAVAVGLRGSGLGRAVRALADRPVQAAQLGVPVGSIRAGVWAVAAVASALAVLLRVPLVGFPVGGLVGPGTLLFGLAAATAARFSDPVRALAAGMAIGLVEQGAVFATGRSAAADVAVFALIVATLLLQRDGRGRLADVRSWLPTREVPALPAPVWRHPRIRVLRVGVTAVVAVGLAVLPATLGDGQATRATALCAFAVVAISSVVLTGWSGQLGLGQVGIAGVGAAVAGSLVAGGGFGSDLFLVLALSGAVGALASVGVGLSALRVVGPQLAIATLAFAFAVPAALSTSGLTGWLLPNGPVERPVLFGWIDLAPAHRFTYVALTLLVLALALARRIRAGRAGRLVLAGRDDVRAVDAVGVEPTRVKALVFATSGALAGVAGAVIAWNQGVVEPATFAPQRSLDIVSAVVIGGISSPTGALVGVLWVFGLPMLFPDSPFVAALGSGVGVLVVLLLQPGGLAVVAGRWWHAAATSFAGLDPGAATRGGSAGRIAGIDVALDLAGRSPHPDRLIRRLELDWADAAGEDHPAPAVEERAGAAEPVGPPAPIEGAVLEVTGLTVRRGRNVVLSDVSFGVRPGECVALVGTNGAGKSTLLAAIAGGLHPRAGTVQIGSRDVTGVDPGHMGALDVAVHPGASSCFPDLTVDEHLALVAAHLDAPPTLTPDEVYRRHPRLAARRHIPARALSGGERHLLGFVLAAMRSPSLLLVDELSLGLAADALEELLAQLAAFKEAGTSIVVVDQRLEHLAGIADRAIFLERGRIRFDGAVAALLADDRLLRPVLSAGSEPDGGGSRAPTTHTADVPPLEVRGVSVAYGSVEVLHDVTLSFPAGHVVGITGGNGAGKTTLLDAISGHVPHTGSVHLDGEDVSGCSPAVRAARGLGRSFQAGSGLDALSVVECLALAQDRGIAARSLVGAAIGLPGAAAADTDVRLRAELLAADSGLLEWLHSPSGDLSTGLRRRLELEMAAAHAPVVLLLDEPTSGIAAAEVDGIVALVRRVAARGAAVVVVDHDHDFVHRACDHVVTLADGRTSEATANRLRRQPA